MIRGSQQTLRKVVGSILILLSSLLIGINAIFAQQSLSQTPIAIQRPADYEYLSAPDSTGKRHPLKMPISSNNNFQAQSLAVEVPYPIIFIHGLNGQSDGYDAQHRAWNDFTDSLGINYGFTYGGRFDFCLNYDGDNGVANKNWAKYAGDPNADLAFWTPTITNGNYYYVNFDVGTNGSYHPTGSAYDVWSNEQAIKKQGAALKVAVQYVLQITGKSKVILMGHSMGGLCAREYLQNSYNWQTDGQHHVAKLITTGTPHGGFSGLGLATDISPYRDAYRDLKDSYWFGGPGVYLFGGLETSSNMWNNLLIPFNNLDVNCNGIYGENIMGLNQKNLNTDVDYACIRGWCIGCLAQPSNGDGVVNDANGNINNFHPNPLPYPANLFYYTASAALQIHTDLIKQVYQNMQGLDEPNEYDLSYGIGFNTTYTGFTTVQAINSSYPIDYDDYTFSVYANSNVSVSVGSIKYGNLYARILDGNKIVVGSTVNNGGYTSFNFTRTLSPGKYYFEIYGTPTTTSYLNPYKFALTSSTVTGIDEVLSSESISFYPNPVNETVFFKLNQDENKIKKIDVYDNLGQLVKTENYSGNDFIDVSNLSTGMYIITVITERSILKSRINVVR